MTLTTDFFLYVAGVRCAVPMARMARTVKTTVVTVLMASAMLSPESAFVTQAFMAPSKSHDLIKKAYLSPCQINSIQ